MTYPSLRDGTPGGSFVIGDAAHAVAPHSAKELHGAEDTDVWQNLLRESNDACLRESLLFRAATPPAYRQSDGSRPSQGQRKEKMSRFAYWFQQQMIRIFVRVTSNKAGLATRLQSGVMRNIMDEEQRGLHVDRIARNPFVGDLIPGTGGASRQ